MNLNLKMVFIVLTALNLQGCTYFCDRWGWFCEADEREAEVATPTKTAIELASNVLEFENLNTCQIDRVELYRRDDENENNIPDALECELVLDGAVISVENQTIDISPVATDLDDLALVAGFMLEPETEYATLVDQVKEAETASSPARVAKAIATLYTTDGVLESYANKANALMEAYSTIELDSCSRAEGDRTLMLVDALQHPAAVYQAADALDAQILSESNFLPVAVPTDSAEARAFAVAVQRLQGLDVPVTLNANISGLLTALNEELSAGQISTLAASVNTDLLNGDVVTLVALGNTVNAAKAIKQQVSADYANAIGVLALGSNDSTVAKVNVASDNWLAVIAGGLTTLSSPQHDVWVDYLSSADVKQVIDTAHANLGSVLSAHVEEPVYSTVQLTYPADDGGTFELEFWKDGVKLALSQVSSGVTEAGDLILSCKAKALGDLEMRVVYVSSDNTPLPPSAVPTFNYNGNVLVLTSFANVDSDTSLSLGDWSLDGNGGVVFTPPEQLPLTSSELFEYAFNLAKGTCKTVAVPLVNNDKATCFIAGALFNPTRYEDEADPYAAFAADVQPMLDAFANARANDDVTTGEYLTAAYPEWLTLESGEFNPDGPSKLAYNMSLLTLADWMMVDGYSNYAAEQTNRAAEFMPLTETCSVDHTNKILVVNPALMGDYNAEILAGEVAKRIPVGVEADVKSYYVDHFPVLSDDPLEHLRRLRWVTGLVPDQRDIQQVSSNEPLSTDALAEIKAALVTYPEAKIAKLAADIRILLDNGQPVTIVAHGSSNALVDAAMARVDAEYPNMTDFVKAMGTGADRNYIYITEHNDVDDLVVNAFNGQSPLYAVADADNRRSFHNHDVINNYWSQASDLGLDVDLAIARSFTAVPTGANQNDRIASLIVGNIQNGDLFTVTGDLLTHATQNGNYYDFHCDDVDLLSSQTNMSVNYSNTRNDRALTAERVPNVTLYVGDREGDTVGIETIDLGGFFNQQPPQQQEIGPFNFSVDGEGEVSVQTGFDQVPELPTLATVVAQSLSDPTVNCDAPATYAVDAANAYATVSDIPNAWRCKIRMSVYENQSLPTAAAINANPKVATVEADSLRYIRYLKDATAVASNPATRTYETRKFLDEMFASEGVSSINDFLPTHQERMHVARCDVDKAMFEVDGYFEQLVDVGQRDAYPINPTGLDDKIIVMDGNRSFTEMDFLLMKAQFEEAISRYIAPDFNPSIVYVNNLGKTAPFGFSAENWQTLVAIDGEEALWDSLKDVYMWERGCSSNIDAFTDTSSALAVKLKRYWNGYINQRPLIESYEQIIGHDEINYAVHSITRIFGTNYNGEVSNYGQIYANTGISLGQIAFIGLNSQFATTSNDFGNERTFGKPFIVQSSSYLNDVLGTESCLNHGQISFDNDSPTPGGYNPCPDTDVVGAGVLAQHQYDKSGGNLILSYLTNPDLITAIYDELRFYKEENGSFVPQGPWFYSLN